MRSYKAMAVVAVAVSSLGLIVHSRANDKHLQFEVEVAHNVQIDPEMDMDELHNEIVFGLPSQFTQFNKALKMIADAPNADAHAHKHKKLAAEFKKTEDRHRKMLADYRGRQVQKRDTNAVVVPRVVSATVLGPSINDPEQQYIDVPSEALPGLAPFLLQPELNPALSNMDVFYNGSGALQLDASTQPQLKDMAYKPLFERDGGLGGTIGDKKVFLFCDTTTYNPSGDVQGFTSNSVAVDVGNNAFEDHALTLQDQLGEFAGADGTLRNWIPFTVGEQEYNDGMDGEQRYAIWPGSSVIPHGHDSALLYAPIVWTNAKTTPVTMSYVGTTLVRVTVPGAGGPVAERIVPLLWAGGIEWGCIGGIRKVHHHPDNKDSDRTGKVYILGSGAGGLYLGRVNASHVTDINAYEFWHTGGEWSATAPAEGSDEYFVTGSYSNVDIFFAPRYKTFVMVSMNAMADSVFHWQYLQAPAAIDTDMHDEYVEHITRHPWSAPEVLFACPPGASYAYAGGMYRGYFEASDITEGGARMLVGWTQQTGDPAGSGTGLERDTAVVVWA